MVVMADLFDRYVQRMTPTEAELETARRRRDTGASRIKLPGLVETLNSGSYIKGTSIRPFTDIDLFVGFAPSEYDKDETRVITRLQYYLRQSFPIQDVRLQTHSVGITFSDGFRVDVVPGFQLRRGEGFYHVRNRDDGRWVTTNVRLHREFFSRRVDRDGRFKDVIRLAKLWKNGRRVRFSSYLLELLVFRAFKDGLPRGRDVALNQFFAWLARGGLDRPVVFNDYYPVKDLPVPPDPLVVLDPTNPKNNVAAALTAPALSELVSAANRARARSSTALSATSRGRAAAAWRDVLPGFPSV